MIASVDCSIVGSGTLSTRTSWTPCQVRAFMAPGVTHVVRQRTARGPNRDERVVLRPMGVRVVVTGATGNVGTSVVRALGDDPAVDEIVGVARRLPSWQAPRVRWVSADVARDDLAPLFAGVDAVIHLAWLIQPSRDAAELERVNVEGSRRVFEAASAAGVGALVHASSIGVYSPGPKDRPVDESWPREGIDSLFYARHKAAAEHALDAVEASNPR